MSWIFEKKIVRRLPKEWGDIVPTEVFIKEALSIVEEAERHGLIIRIMGGLAIRIHSEEYEDFAINIRRYGDPTKKEQEYTDIDFMAYEKQRKKLTKFLIERFGYIKRRATLSTAASIRQIYFHKDGWFYIDVFYDKLMVANHPIDFRGRLDLDNPTVPLTELLLEKIQMWEAFGEKDFKDVILLLRAHDISDKDERECINGKYIAKILARDWGFWYTATTNLKRIKRIMSNLDSYYRKMNIAIEKIGKEDIGIIIDRIDKLQEMINSEPKTLKWKIRNLIGTRKRWYNHVERPDTVGGFGIWEALEEV